jgi:mRNA-degrading endonuclease toxin of MazEF toxin-antitoxin module
MKMTDYRNAEYYSDPTPHKALRNIAGEVKRGDIYMIRKNYESNSEKLPCVIVSSDSINSRAGFIMYVLIYENVDDSYSSNIPISRGNVRGCAVCSKVCTASKDKLAELVGACADFEMREIEGAILESLGMVIHAEAAPPVTKATPPPKSAVIVKDDPEKDAKIVRLEAEKAILEKLYKELLQSTLAK